MQFGGARWSLGGPGWSPGAARGFPGGFGEQNECFRNGVFGPLVLREGVWGGSYLNYSEESDPQWC